MAPLVFITGGSGFLGSKVIVDALTAGYRVRASVRKAAQGEAIKAIKSIASFVSQLEIVIVPSLDAEGVFDDLLVGVDYVLHVASPLAAPEDGNFAGMVNTAWAGTESVLRAAEKNTSVKRVVITSSNWALSTFAEGLGGMEEPVTDQSVGTVSPPPYDNHFLAYHASKVVTFKATKEYIAKASASSHFDIINLHPSLILGKKELATSAADIMNGSNGLLFAPILGSTDPPLAISNATIYVGDVSAAHIRALDKEKVPGNRSYLLNIKASIPSAVEIVKKEFPKAVADGILPATGSRQEVNYPMDTSTAEKYLGMEFTPFEVAVKEIAQQYIELSASQ
ncbi:MAG: hypothetical protein M1814_003952 [Vezdaea aestivalis]|nr:MAG: hypothetical protein M1814_003952 [Vezdaea aestivalis]